MRDSFSRCKKVKANRKNHIRSQASSKFNQMEISCVFIKEKQCLSFTAKQPSLESWASLFFVSLTSLWNRGLFWQAHSLLLRELLGSWITHELKLQLIQLLIFKEKWFFKRGKMQHLLFALCQLSPATANSNNISLQWGQKVTLPGINYHAQTLQMSKHKPTRSKSG